MRRVQRDGKPAVKVDYEITISTTLLYNTFQNVERTVTVGGLVCRDRLESLQRIFEHELLHLAEFLGWGRSNCRADNFHALSRRIFAHEGAFHDLITPREQARAAFDIHVGDHVSFELDGAAARRARQSDHAPAPPSWSKTPAAGSTPTASAIVTFYVPCRFCARRARRAESRPRAGVADGANPCHPDRFGRS